MGMKIMEFRTFSHTHCDTVYNKGRKESSGVFLYADNANWRIEIVLDVTKDKYRIRFLSIPHHFLAK